MTPRKGRPPLFSVGVSVSVAASAPTMSRTVRSALAALLPRLILLVSLPTTSSFRVGRVVSPRLQRHAAIRAVFAETNLTAGAEELLGHSRLKVGSDELMAETLAKWEAGKTRGVSGGTLWTKSC